MEHPEDLIGYLTGDLDSPDEAEAIRRHLEICPDCRNRLAEIEAGLDFVARASRVAASDRCPDEERFIAYHIEGEMPDAERRAFEAHLAECPACRQRLEDFGDPELPIPEPDASRLPAWLADRIGAGGSPRRGTEDSGVVDLSARRAPSDLEQGPAFGDRVADDHPELQRWAASPAYRFGKSWGVAVLEGSGRGGGPIRVSVSVSGRESDRPGVTIVADQVRGVGGIQVDGTFSVMKERLTGLFKTIACLRALALDRREIRFTLDTEDPAEKARSLTLALLVAAVKAACGIAGDDRRVFTGDVDQDGALTAVGNSAAKAALALDRGLAFVAPRANRDDVVAGVGHEAGLQERVSFFTRFDEMFTTLYGTLSMVGEDSTGDGSDSPRPPKGASPAGPDNTADDSPHSWIRPVYWALVALSVPVFFVYLAGACQSGDPFFHSKLLLALHLKDTTGQVFEIVKLLGFLAPFAVPLAFGVNLKRGWRRRHGALSRWFGILVACFWGFCLALPNILVGTLYLNPDRLAQYARIEPLMPLKSRSGFSLFLRDVPDVRYQAFLTEAGSPDWPDRRRAVDIGLPMPVGGVHFPEVFETSASVLQDVRALGDREWAGRVSLKLLFSFMDYVDSLEGRPDEKARIIDLIYTAEALVRHFPDLAGRSRSPEGVTIRQFIAMTKARHGIR